MFLPMTPIWWVSMSMLGGVGGSLAIPSPGGEKACFRIYARRKPDSGITEMVPWATQGHMYIMYFILETLYKPGTSNNRHLGHHCYYPTLAINI